MVMFGSILDIYSSAQGLQMADESRKASEGGGSKASNSTQPALSALQRSQTEQRATSKASAGDRPTKGEKKEEKGKKAAPLAFNSSYALQKKRFDSATVLAGDRSLGKTVGLLGRHIGAAVQDVAATAISAGAIGYASAMMTSDDKGDTRGHIAQAAMASMTVVTTALVRSSVTAVVYGSKLDELTAQKDTFKNLKRLTTPEFLKPYPEDILIDVKELDLRVEREIKADNPDAVFFKQRIRHREMVLLARPLSAADLTYGGDAVKVKLVMSEVAELCKYTEDPDVFKTLALRIIMNSVSPNPTRVQAYLHGPGGVGKTWLIQSLAKILGVPFIYLRVEQERDVSGVKKLLGSRWSVDYYAPDTQDEDLIGELPLQMIKAGCTNPIIFIDELKVNELTISDLNILLDPLKEELKIGGYNSTLDWRCATVLVGSNDELTNEPLQTRMLMMHFSKTSDEVKRLVILSKVEAETASYAFALDKPQMRRLISTMRTRCDELIAIDNEKFPGARYVQAAAAQTVHYVAAGLLEDNPRTAKGITEFMNKRYEYFAKFEASRRGDDVARH